MIISNLFSNRFVLNRFLFCFGDEPPAGGGSGDPEKKFSQADLDRVVQDRLERERKKYGDYDDLKKFKDDHEKNADAQKQKELEDQKKYEELKKGWSDKETNYQKIIADKETENKNLKIDHALSVEISSQNLYPEAKDVLRTQVTLDKDGMPKMKGKDQYGAETLISLADGIKEFAKQKPYLVRGSANSGGGSPPNPNGNGGGDVTLELAELNSKFLQAVQSGNRKEAEALKVKIQNYFTSKKISRT